MVDFAEDLLDKPPVRKEYAEDVLERSELDQTKDLSGEAMDTYFASKSVGKVLDLFGQGFQQAWGTEHLDAAMDRPQYPGGKSLADYGRNWGYFNDYKKGEYNAIKFLNEYRLRSSAAALEFFMRTPYAIARGLAEVPGLNLIGGPASAAFEGGIGEIPHAPALREVAPQVRSMLGRAHDLDLLDERRATDRTAQEALAPTGTERPTERVVLPDTPIEEAPVVPAADIPAAAQTANELARTNQPALFEKWDGLQEQKNTFTKWLDEIRQKTAAPIQEEIDTILGKVRGNEDRLTNAAALRLALRRRELEEALTTETPELSIVRKELLRTDEQMRDIAPDVSQAYREARDQIPEAEPTPQEPVPPPQSAEVIPLPSPATLADLGIEPQQIANLAQRQRSIASDVASKLVDAGRPLEEAQSLGALMQAHYQARAQRFGGALGPARDIYNKEAPEIRAGEGSTRGRMTIGPERNIITLMQNADASTFLHETAHNWFEELLRDSKHEAAPPRLLEDVAAVRDWLDMQGERPSRAQHEKFARGFERYMMEGVAPTTRLANVFAQFKDWLTRIYQTVSALRAPINDEIRGVYSRLLSNETDRAVIAPERELVRNFADQHEADVATLQRSKVTPEDVTALADRIRAERDIVATALRGEMDLARQRARQRRRGGNGERAGVAAGGDAGAKSDNVRARADEETATERSGRVESPTPAEPEDSFIRTPNEYVSADGKFKLENVSRPEDFDAAIEASSQPGEARNVGATDGEILRLSNSIGIEPMFLDGAQIGQAYSAAEIRAITEMAKQSATNVWKLMRGVSEGKVDPLELAQAIARHEMIQGKAQALASEWGRAGLALQELKKFTGDPEALNFMLKDLTGRSYDQLQFMAKLGKWLQTPGQVSSFIAKTSGEKLKNGIVFYWVNSLVSGPISHAAYIAGNAINALADPLLYRPGAAAIDSLRGRKTDRVYWQEVGASFYGLTKGSWDAWPAAYAAFKTGQTGVGPGTRSFTFANPIPGVVGQAIGIPYKSVSAIHQFFLTMRYEQEIQTAAVREALDKGLQGQSRANFVAQMTQSPTQAMMDTAETNAYTEMYMRSGKFNSPISMLTRELHRTLPGQIIFPFVKIGAEITRQTFVKHTPVGLAWEEVRSDILGKNGGAAQSTALAKQGVGMAMLGSGVFLASQGVINGFGPADPNRRREWLNDHQPYSINIGNLQIPMKGLGPLGNLMMFGADTWETGHYMKEDDDMGKWAAGYTKAIARGVLEESIFRDLTTLHEVINDPEQHADRWLGEMVANWLPFSIGVGQVNRGFIDPYSKDVHNVFDAVRARIPVASWGVPNRIDYFGNPVPSRGYNINKYANDPVQQVMDRLNVSVGRLDRHINDVELTPKQYEEYGILSGQMAYQLLSGTVTQPGFQGLPVGIQVREINKLIGTARNIARAKLKMSSYGTDNDLVSKGVENKLKQLR